MRTHEFRASTLSSAEALDSYRTVNYPRHMASCAHHDIGFHGLWTVQCGSPVLYALASYAEGEDPVAVTQLFMNSADVRADIDGFDTSAIVNVTTTLLKPSEGSPLRRARPHWADLYAAIRGDTKGVSAARLQGWAGRRSAAPRSRRQGPGVGTW